jgi:hypothetical protein
MTRTCGRWIAGRLRGSGLPPAGLRSGEERSGYGPGDVVDRLRDETAMTIPRQRERAEGGPGLQRDDAIGGPPSREAGAVEEVQ